MLGSHNSFTFLKPVKNRLLSPFAKCQSKDLITQYDDGVRFFDFRFKFDSSMVQVSHGLVDYEDYGLYEMLDLLNDLAKKERIYYRILLEYNRKPEAFFYIKKTALRFCDCLEDFCPNLINCGVYCKWDGKPLKETSNTLQILHKYSSVLGWKRFFWIPWLYAKIYNKKFKKEFKSVIDSDDQVLLLDFV